MSPQPTHRGGGAARTGGHAPSYDVFLSYSHAADKEFAADLQRRLERFAKPWLQRRATRVFRDEASLSADAKLWSSVVAALERSTWFVLLASPQSAASRWVRREVAWWLAHRSADHILIVHTHGTIAWDAAAGDFAWERTDSLPPDFTGVFAEEPHWVEGPAAPGRPVEAVVADVASTVRGVPKDELLGEHLREHRRTVRRAGAAITALAVLLVLAVVASLLAVSQRNTAVRQATIAGSRQLAASADVQLDAHLDVAQLLAVQAHRQDPNPQARAALVHAVTANPPLRRFLPVSSRPTAVAASDDGTTAIIGLRDGRVLAWPVDAPAPRTLLVAPGPVEHVHADASARTVVAASGGTAWLWRDGRPMVEVGTPDPTDEIVAAALSPSGHQAVIARRSRGVAPSSATVVDVESGARRVVPVEAGTSTLQIPSDDEVLVLEGVGEWTRRRLTDWSVIVESRDSLVGAAHFAGAPSRDGRFFVVTSPGPALIVPTDVPSLTPASRPLEAAAPSPSARAIALSPDAGRFAVTDGGTIFVSPVPGLGATATTPTTLRGANGTIDDGLRFLGSGDRLLSASENAVAVWDVSRVGRAFRGGPTADPGSCNACPGAEVVLSPDGRLAAFPSGTWSNVAVQRSDGAAAASEIVLPTNLGHAPPAWLPDGTLVLPIDERQTAGVSAPAAPPGVRVVAWPYGRTSVPGTSTGFRGAVSTGVLADGRVVLVLSDGVIQVHDGVTGRLLDQLPGPSNLPTDREGLLRTSVDTAATSPDGLVAVAGPTAVTITGLSDRAVVGSIPGAVTDIDFSRGRLVLHRPDDTVEVWDPRSAVRSRTLPGEDLYVDQLVVQDTGDLLARQRLDGTLDLVDLERGVTLGTLPAVGGADHWKTGATFAPHRSTLVTATEVSGADTVLGRRDLDDTALVRTACETAGRFLTPEEWDRHVGTAAPSDLTCG